MSKWALAVFEAVTASRDIVGWDDRGRRPEV